MAANQHSDHDTICSYRRRFFQPLGELFTQILLVAAEMGLTELGDVSIDGSKFNANASSNGWQQAWNGQIAVDMDTHLIVGGHLSQAPNDKQELEPTLDSLEALPKRLGEPKRITADNGYYSEDNVSEATTETSPLT